VSQPAEMIGSEPAQRTAAVAPVGLAGAVRVDEKAKAAVLAAYVAAVWFHWGV
jgi:hypothetical protein